MLVLKMYRETGNITDIVIFIALNFIFNNVIKYLLI